MSFCLPQAVVRGLRLVLATFLCLAATNAGTHAQAFSVVSAIPAPGAVAVPQTTRLTFEFSAAVSAETDWNEAFQVLPAGAAEVTRVSLCLSGGATCGADEGEARFVWLDVTHTGAAQDLTWIVAEIESADGTPLDTPYTLHYTTASTGGAHAVTGTITPAEVTKRPDAWTRAPETRSGLQQTLLTLQQAHLGLPVYAPVSEVHAVAGRTPRTAHAGAARTGGPLTVVYLLQDVALGGETKTVARAAAVAEEAASFALPDVRAGTYLPVVVRYADGVAGSIEALGYYRPDGASSPQTLTVPSPHEISLALVTFERQPARQLIDRARALAPNGADLLRVRAASGAGTSGTAYSWRYSFAYAGTPGFAEVTVDPLAETREDRPPPSYAARVQPVPAAFIDSDAAMDAALASGGADFLAVHAAASVAVVIDGGNLYWKKPSITTERFWQVRMTTPGGEAFETLVDMGTGETGVTRRGDTPAPTSTLRTYPNPARSTTYVAYTLPAPAPVEIAVFDLLGRRVTTLTDGYRAAGAHRVAWDGTDAAGARVAPGIYLVRMRSDTETQHVHRVTRLR